MKIHEEGMYELDLMDARAEGKAEGFKQWKEQGKKLGKELGIKGFINSHKNVHVTHDQIIEQLIKYFELSPKQAQEYYRKYDGE